MSANCWAALAVADFQGEFERELRWRGVRAKLSVNNLYLFEGEYISLFWSQVQWKNAEIIPFPSISKAAELLREREKFWAHLSLEQHRRGELILKQSRAIREQSIVFPERLEKKPCGTFALNKEEQMLLLLQPDRVGNLGLLHFQENKTAPSRAYLKLWEALTRLDTYPNQKDHCLDLGACPGGWSWVLAELGAKVIAVDTAPLDLAVSKRENVKFLKKDAFSLNPADFPDVQWLCSDMACYPEKLLDLVKRWSVEGNVKNFICTLKLQGESDFSVIQEFANLGQVLHLNYNKHELTWWKKTT